MIAEPQENQGPSVPKAEKHTKPGVTDMRAKGQQITEAFMSGISRRASLERPTQPYAASPQPVRRRHSLAGPATMGVQQRRRSLNARKVCEDKEQFAKLKAAMRNKGAKTTLSMMHEMEDLLQQRVDDMQKPKRGQDETSSPKTPKSRARPSLLRFRDFRSEMSLMKNQGSVMNLFAKQTPAVPDVPDAPPASPRSPGRVVEEPLVEDDEESEDEC
mmetsp:Transcript_25758/g.59849  ORF Transcript_25758/g.59849 Transcript_25758/m.59849 type:complete len:216 (+) Transcript_25758:158-805(+)